MLKSLGWFDNKPHTSNLWFDDFPPGLGRWGARVANMHRQPSCHEEDLQTETALACKAWRLHSFAPARSRPAKTKAGQVWSLHLKSLVNTFKTLSKSDSIRSCTCPHPPPHPPATERIERLRLYILSSLRVCESTLLAALPPNCNRSSSHTKI